MAAKTKLLAQEVPAKATNLVDTKELAKVLGTTPKMLRRYLRAQKFQRTEKRWGLDTKIQQAAKEHFLKPKAEAAPAEAPKS